MCDYKSRLCCAFSHPQWLALHGYDKAYDDNLNRYTHDFFFSESLWDPSILDHKFTAHDFDDPDISFLCHENNDPCVDGFGHIAGHHAHIDSIVETFTVLAQTVFAMTVAALSAFPQHLHPYLPDLEVLCPHFGWLPVNRICNTLKATIWHYCTTIHHPF